MHRFSVTCPFFSRDLLRQSGFHALRSKRDFTQSRSSRIKDRIADGSSGWYRGSLSHSVGISVGLINQDCFNLWNLGKPEDRIRSPIRICHPALVMLYLFHQTSAHSLNKPTLQLVSHTFRVNNASASNSNDSLGNVDFPCLQIYFHVRNHSTFPP